MTHPQAEYNSIAKIVHWWIAGMIVLQLVLAKLAERAEDAGSQLQQLALLGNHKSVGITILGVAVFRLAWRTFKPPPVSLPMPYWQKTASLVSHWTLYGLLFLMPITGWLMSSASAYSVSWFNLIQLPDFIGPNANLKETLEEIHETLAKVLFTVAAIHIAAALKHAFINKDGALRRISSRSSIAIFAVVIIGGFLSLSDVGGDAFAPVTPGSSIGVTPMPIPVVSNGSKLPLWEIDYDASYIRFTADQAGANFDGAWQSWTAKLRFSPDDLAAGSFDVTIEAASVETGDDDRDSTIVDKDWFNAENFPQVFYRAADFSAQPDGSFVANGTIVVRNSGTPAPLSFTVSEAAGRTILNGTATLDRLLLQVGQGEWEDTEWVGQFVEVAVHVEAVTRN